MRSLQADGEHQRFVTRLRKEKESRNCFAMTMAATTIAIMNMRALIVSFFSLFCTNLLAQEKAVRLYEGPAPGSENWKQEEKENRTNLWQTRVVFNVANPTLTVFPADPSRANGTAVVICPGGAFFALSIDSEGFDVARWLNTKGVTCFVLKYRLVECWTGPPRRDPPNCTCSQKADMASACESKTFPPTTGLSVSPIGWKPRGC